MIQNWNLQCATRLGVTYSKIYYFKETSDGEDDKEWKDGEDREDDIDGEDGEDDKDGEDGKDGKD